MRQDSVERAVLIGLELTGSGRNRAGADGAPFRLEESMEELTTLARSAGANVVDASVQKRDRADPATLIGAGKVEEIQSTVRTHDADLIVFDNELSPTQQRNLERELDCRVIDRTPGLRWGARHRALARARALVPRGQWLRARVHAGTALLLELSGAYGRTLAVRRGIARSLRVRTLFRRVHRWPVGRGALHSADPAALDKREKADRSTSF